MGKIVTYLVILVFLELLFIVTGQMCIQGDCTIGSTIFSTLLNLNNFTNGSFWSDLIGDFQALLSNAATVTGLFSLLAGAGVLGAVIITNRSPFLLRLIFGIPLAIIASDFVFLFGILAPQNIVLATFIFAPLVITFALILIEWAGGTD